MLIIYSVFTKLIISTSKEDYAQAREHVTNAAKSKSYLYPIKVRKS